YSGGLHLDPHQIGLDRCPIALDDFHRLSSSPTNRSCVCRSDEFASARARRTDAPLSSAPCDQGRPYVPLYTRNPLFAFFSFFAARFSIRLLAGFFFASFFVSIALLITGLLGLEGTIGILHQSEQIRVIGNSANSEQAARRRGGSADACAARSAPNQSGLSRTLACSRRFPPGAPRLELGTPCTTYALVCCLTLLDSSAQS